jgi:hypothetical protein
MRDEANYTCPHCGEDIVIPIDVSAGHHQDYTEDCPICCEPIVIHLDLDSVGEVELSVESEQDFYN